MKIAAFTIDGNGTFAQDVPAFAAAIAAAGADIILAPGTSRARRSLPAAALRAGAAIDTNAVAVTVDGDKVSVQGRMPAPISQVKTCGQCHDVPAMAGGSHFRTGLDTNDAPPSVNFEPWFLVGGTNGPVTVTVRGTDSNGKSADTTYTPHVVDNTATKTVDRTISYEYADGSPVRDGDRPLTVTQVPAAKPPATLSSS